MPFTKTQLTKGVVLNGLQIINNQVIVPPDELDKFNALKESLNSNQMYYDVTYKLNNPKSTAQRKYYWAVVLIESLAIFPKLGYPGIDDIYLAHSFFKSAFLGQQIKIQLKVSEEPLEYFQVKSTESLTMTEYANYIQEIIKCCNDCEVQITEANSNNT